MKPLRITDKVYKYYMSNVRGNKEATYEEACKKLTRNMLLGKEVPQRTDRERLLGNKLYIYGNLRILVRQGKIVHISNHKGTKRYSGRGLDKEKRDRLNMELGIKD